MAKEHTPIENYRDKKGKFRTICQIHREVYALLHGEGQTFKNKDKMDSLLREAYEAGISMDRKLTEYAGKPQEWKRKTFKINQ